MSNIGKPARQLWFDNLYNKSSTQSSSLQIKFLYGHILEELLLMLVRMSGHKVTDEQKEVVVDGIKGHIDCKIDGEVVDIKSASGFAFSKFSKGILPEDDPSVIYPSLLDMKNMKGQTMVVSWLSIKRPGVMFLSA